jgi:hypothetical protein
MPPCRTSLGPSDELTATPRGPRVVTGASIAPLGAFIGRSAVRSWLTVRSAAIARSVPQQFRHGVQLLHVLRHNLTYDNDGNAKQQPPDAPQPTPEQQRYEHGC